jgi:hypothetical protein
LTNSWKKIFMPTNKPNQIDESRKQRLTETCETLTALQFGPKQRNEIAAYTLLALLNLRPDVPWAESEVWIAEDPDHMIHFNGERFLGPYPDVLPK